MLCHTTRKEGSERERSGWCDGEVKSASLFVVHLRRKFPYIDGVRVGERYRSKRILPSYTHIRKRKNKHIKEKEANGFVLETLAAGGENMFFLGKVQVQVKWSSEYSPCPRSWPITANGLTTG